MAKIIINDISQKVKSPQTKTLINFNWSNLKLILFLAGLVLSIYQTALLLHGFITQPIVSKIIPQQATYLERPDIVICKNIYAELMGTSQMETAQLRLLAIQARDFAPYLRLYVADGVQITANESIMDQLEEQVQSISYRYLNCSSMLGKCTSLLSGFGLDRSHDCCDVAQKVLTEEEVCYRVSLTSFQNGTGKTNAAVYELRYGTQNQNGPSLYSIHIVDKADPVDTFRYPVGRIKAGSEINIEVQKQVSVRVNYTEKCAIDPSRVMPLCGQLKMKSMTLDSCGCDPMLSVANKLKTRVRTCRPLEKWKCYGQLRQNKTRLGISRNSYCYRYSRVCKSTEFVAKVNIIPLPDQFDTYMRDEENAADRKMAVLYVYFGSMTVLYNYESQSQTWLTVVSSLGGVWGLWLGWSLYDAANMLIVFVVKARLNYKKITQGIKASVVKNRGG